MPALASLDQERVMDHLGYSAPNSIPSGDFERLMQQMNSLRSDYNVNQIKYFLDRCDRALEASELVYSDGIFTQKQLIAGDVNRTTLTVSREDANSWWENYLKETDHLAYRLNVANYQRPQQARYRWERLGAEYVASTPGVADTCTNDRVELAANYA